MNPAREQMNMSGLSLLSIAAIPVGQDRGIHKITPMKRTLSSCLLLGLLSLASTALFLSDTQSKEPQENPRLNVVFILTDDQRFDELGFINEELVTPNLDRLAEEGVYFRNSFVTTSLCSPSRASILTGLYAHAHGVVDNLQQNLKDGTRFFPEDLRDNGYQTAFIGKWHMGRHTDEQQPGFDHWVSFAGQGHYFPTEDSLINVDGTRVKQKGYITDELTDYAIDWLDDIENDRPFFLYLSHKAVHADFIPAKRHEDLYTNLNMTLPNDGGQKAVDRSGTPMWVKNQRNSFHGVDFPYHTDLDVKEYKRNYHRTLAAVDESLGEVLRWLENNDLLETTVVMYMGDNGFMFGEHGLIDKRNAYEESMRVPLLAYAPGLLPAGTVVDEMIANIDIAPTILDIAGLRTDRNFHGSSFLNLAQGRQDESWRKSLVYEYFWEWVFPHTPSTFALRTDKYKLIQYHGIWDTDELFDLENDPNELNNLINEPELRSTVRDMREQLFNQIMATDGSPDIRYTMKQGQGLRFRSPQGAEAAEFPESVFREANSPDREDYKE